ncbi:MAG: TonB-dependent receptor, partial [Bacteroidota bacterium]|nr:TonB-dependent receptor [Bacteroidota bacterium]
FTTFSGKEKTYQAWYGVAEADLAKNRRINYAGTEKPGEPYENQTDNYTQTHYQFFLNQKLSTFLNFNTGLFYIKGSGYYEQYKANQKYINYGLKNITNGSTIITKSDLVRQLWLANDFYGDIFSLQYAKEGTEVTIGGAATKYVGHHFGEVIWAKNGLSSTGQKWYNLNADKTDFNIYTKWQQNLSKSLQFFADLQVRNVGHTINGFQNNPTIIVAKNYTFFNPKMGLTYHNKNWIVFSSYSIGNKEPNRDDFEASQNDQPHAEHLQDIEIGIEKKTKNFNTGATLYYMRYKNQLVLTGKINDVGAYTRTNIDNSYRLGVELEGSTNISKWLKASANITFSRDKIKNFTEFIDDYDNGGQKLNTYPETDLSYSPSILGAATLTFTPSKKWSIDLLSKYVGKQYLDNTSNEARKLNAFYTQDLRAAYSFTKGWLKNASVIFQVNNLFDKKYEPNGYTYSYFSSGKLTTENYYFPMAGINWMAGINVWL